jgi:hypothetical protein
MIAPIKAGRTRMPAIEGRDSFLDAAPRVAEDFGLLPLQRHAQSFEQAGFSYERSKGKNHCVMRRTVSPAEAP